MFYRYGGVNPLPLGGEALNMDGGGIVIVSGDWWTYDTEARVLNITANGAMPDVVPGQIPWETYLTDIRIITLSNVTTTIGNYAFYGCSNLDSLYVNGAVTSIGQYAFTGCGKAGIDLSGLSPSLVTISERAFYNDTALNQITLPTSLTSIGEFAFFGCTNLTSITIPQNVTSIGARAFDGCSSMTAIRVSGDNQIYSSDAYGVLFNKAITEIIRYPCGKTGSYDFSNISTLTSVDNFAFYACSNLTSIVLPYEITSIGASAFESCTALTGVTFAGGSSSSLNASALNSIGHSGFRGCAVLTNITLPSEITSIGESAFQGCTGLTGITIPSSVNSLGESAFQDCTNLLSLTIDNGLSGISKKAFYYCSSLTNATIPDSVTTIGDFAFENCVGLSSAPLPGNLSGIGKSAFRGCTGIQSVVFPSSVSSIGYASFYNCTGITQIKFGHNVTSIGDFAFGNCSGITGEVIIPDEVPFIGEYAFQSCSGIESVTLGSNTESVGFSAFNGCFSLREVIISNASMTDVGSYAFNGCASLSDVYFTGSEEQWDDITIDSHNNPLINATIHYNFVRLHTVTFDLSGGVSIDITEQEIIHGQTATNPGGPVKKGYSFVNWDLNGSAYDFTSPVLEDLRLTAEWTTVTYPRNMADVAREIATLIGVKMDPDTTLNETYMMNNPTGFTAREILAGIAGANCGNFIITQENKLSFVPIRGIAEEYNIGDDCLSLTRFARLPAVTKVIVTLDSGSVSSGQNSGDKTTLAFDCKFVSQSTANQIASDIHYTIGGYQYQGFSAEAARITPTAKLGSAVTVSSESPVSSTLAYQVLTFSPACFSDISAPSETQEADHEIAYQNPTSTEANRNAANLQSVESDVSQTSSAISDFIRVIASASELPSDWATQNRIFVVIESS